MKVSARSWYNYEKGVTVPGEILLRLIETLKVEPLWLLKGEGPRFRDGKTENENPETSHDATTSTQIALGLLKIALKLIETKEVGCSRLNGRPWKPSPPCVQSTASPSPDPGPVVR
jgi:hypothetical protein